MGRPCGKTRGPHRNGPPPLAFARRRMIRLPAQNEPWLAVLPLDGAPALAEARLCPGIEIAAAGDALWLRGAHFGPEIATALKVVSGLEWREPLPAGRWRHPGDLLP